MASRYRAICTPASRIFKSMATPSPKPTLASSITPRSSQTALSRSSSRSGCVQSLLPLQSAVSSSARLTSCDSKGSRSLSQPLRLCFPVQTREFGIFSSRRLLMGPSMTLAAVASTKVIPPAYAFCISRLGGYRNSYFKTHPLAHANKDDEFTPTAWEVIKTSKLYAINLEQKYIEPECLMLALLKPKQCIAKDVLVEAECDIKFMQTKMHEFLLQQLETTDYWFLKSIKNYVLAKYYRFLVHRRWLSRMPMDSSYREVFNSNNPDKGPLRPLLSEANVERAKMGDNLIGEEHIVIAYCRGTKFGRHLFTKMNVLEDDLRSAVQAIRSNLKKQEDHVKVEEITLTGMEEKTGKC